MTSLDFARHIKHRLFPVRRPEKPDSPRDREYELWSAADPSLNIELGWSETCARFASPNEIYRYLHHYFHHRAPSFLREHRNYFRQERRGFGEDAFHAMWWLLFLEFHPVRCAEIGVYRGQVISLWTRIAKVLNQPLEALGISPLSPAGDVVSGDYLASLDYQDDISRNFAHFGLGSPQLLKALSTDDVAVSALRSQKWDLIYIDGNHDEPVVTADYELSRECLRPGGLMIMDDSGLELGYKPPAFSFGGHPGPSKVARTRAANELELLGVVGHNVVFRKAV